MDPQFNTGGGGLTMPPLPPPPQPPQPPPPQQQQQQRPIGGNPRYGVKYRAYTDEDMRKAAHAILDEGMSLRRASMTFNVPKTTLAERMGDKRPRLVPPSQPPATAIANRNGNGSSGSSTIRGGADGNKKRPPPPTRYTWTEAEMEQAVEAVQAGGESVREVARRFGVPPSNLNSRTRGRQPKDLKGEVSRLTLKQESLLADWASAQGALGFPPSKDEVYDLAERVMRKTAADGGSGGGGGDNNKKLGKQVGILVAGDFFFFVHLFILLVFSGLKSGYFLAGPREPPRCSISGIC